MKERYQRLVEDLEDLVFLVEMASMDESHAFDLDITVSQARDVMDDTVKAFEAIDNALEVSGWYDTDNEASE